MTVRRNDFDVTNSVNTTDATEVSGVVARLYEDAYQRDAPENFNQAFVDVGRIYRGEYPGFHECDTDYHDIQHVLDVTLALARMMDGYVRSKGAGALSARLFQFGIVAGLYHDSGYIRKVQFLRHQPSTP